MAEAPTTDTLPLALTSHRGTRAIQRLVEYAPSTGGLALWVAHQDLPAQADADAADPDSPGPLLRTDGTRLGYSPAFETLPLSQQAGLVAHAVLHIALRHAQRYAELKQLLGDVDLRLFNICADAIVNSALRHLGWLQLPTQAVTLDRLLSRTLRVELPEELALLQWDVESLYRAIDDRGPVKPGSTRQTARQRSGSLAAAPGQDPSTGRAQARAAAEAWAVAAAPQRPDGPLSAQARSFDTPALRDLVPGGDGSESPEVAAETTRQWSERLLRAHTSDAEHSLLRVLLADLPRSHTPWQQILRMQLARALAARRSLSWSRPSRSYIANQGRSAGRGQAPALRMPFEPGFSPSQRVPRLVVVVDVSGSIEADQMDRFAREIEAISRRLQAGLTLVIGDCRVRAVARFEPGRSSLRDIVFEGAGGTDFTPLLEEAARHRPDTVVVLTDLDGPARFKPPCPVIWAVPRQSGQGTDTARWASSSGPQAPFGRVLML